MRPATRKGRIAGVHSEASVAVVSATSQMSAAVTTTDTIAAVRGVVC
jgi:hypothetical protein